MNTRIAMSDVNSSRNYNITEDHQPKEEYNDIMKLPYIMKVENHFLI